MTMPDEYVARTKRMHCLFGMLLAAALIYLGLDLHFFHTLRGWRVSPNHVLWVIFSGLGFLILVYSVKTFVSPRTLLKADSMGITIYAGNVSVQLGTKPSVTPPRRGDPCLIPWSEIREIGVGKILTGTQTRKGTGCSTEVLGGTLTVGATIKQNFAKALRVLCDRSVRLQGFDTSGVSQTWNGYTEEELRPMTQEDRDGLTPEDLHSGFVFHHACLNGNLDHAVSVLERLRNTYNPT
jgi:hypothetical protein